MQRCGINVYRIRDGHWYMNVPFASSGEADAPDRYLSWRHQVLPRYLVAYTTIMLHQQETRLDLCARSKEHALHLIVRSSILKTGAEHEQADCA
jgi:hypothetical protein